MGASAILLVWGCVALLAFAASPAVVSHAHTEACSLESTTCTDDSSFQTEEHFPGISRISYEGPESKNPLAFKWYNASEIVYGKPMSEWLRFSVAFWHTMRGDGSDQFGLPTKVWPWETLQTSAMGAEKRDEKAAIATQTRRRLDAFFEVLSKLGVEYWCFHDRDIAPELDSLAESNAALEEAVEHAAQLQAKHGVKLLWGTAQLFKHPRYMHGAATSPNATVFAHAAAQVKAAMEATHRLHGEGYVFWGGREGYSSLLNTDMALETSNMARFLRMAAKYAKHIGFRGTLMLEPKPQEPSKHQYDWDAATTRAFLLANNLEKDFKLNIECNHATLAGHSCHHELTYASEAGLLGSIDANQGDPQTGWDTDEFLTDPREAALVGLVLLRQGGIAPGGLNFDAKLRRESIDVEDLFIGHIAGMDAMARGLRGAAAMLEDGRLDACRSARYSSYFETRLGESIVKEATDLAKLTEFALAHGDPMHGLKSGKQELFEAVFDNLLR